LSTTVLVAEDFTPVRQMLVATLETIPNIRIICEVADGAQAVEKANELRPDLILLDIGLPTLNGIEAAHQISRLVPTATILFVSQNSDAEIVNEALSNGAKGYVRKQDVSTDLVPAMGAVLRGERFVSKTLSRDAQPTR
jgi:DNA-binding NarL/FixJ family response regulator